MSSVDYVSAINTKGSGLNITQIVESLVEAETKPKKDLVDKKIEDKNLDISSIGQLTSEINTLQTSLNGLANTSRFKASSGSVANTITVSDVAKAKEAPKEQATHVCHHGRSPAHRSHRAPRHRHLLCTC